MASDDVFVRKGARTSRLVSVQAPRGVAVVLRREVITDPIQLAPVREQVRSVLPWWRRVLVGLMLWGGCASEPVGPTLGEAVEEVAFGQCSRWIRCGTTSEAWDACVASLVMDFCGVHDCTAPYPDYRWDNVSTCSAWYADLQCGLWVEPCGV